MAGRKRNFLKQCKKGCPRAKFARLEPEKAQFNGLDQKLLRKDDRVHQGTKMLCDRSDDVEDQELSLKQRRTIVNQLKETLGAKENEI